MAIRPSFSVQVRTDYTDFLYPENHAQHLPRFLCLKSTIRQPWNACQYFQKSMLLFSSIFVHNKCCTPPQIHNVRTDIKCCLLPRNSCLLFALGCVPLLLQMLSLFSKLDLSLLFFLSQQKCMNNPKMGAPLNPNRPHEVGEEFSNPMAEIRLDVWLRFDVSSFTLIKVIKSPFNLHLTN
jgi:hypothetical protein